MNDTEKEQFRLKLEELAGKIHTDVFSQFENRFHAMKTGTNEAEMPQVSFQTVYAAVLVKIAAILAVDSGIDKSKFNAIADESWNHAYQVAPKFH